MNPQQAREQLEQTRQSIVTRKKRLAEHVEHRKAPLPADFAEQAVELENEETMVALARELTIELKNVERALLRIDADTYGACTTCGEAINPERLEALPATPLCVRCATAASS
jgi:RNA polymerase-binding protein DksA